MENCGFLLLIQCFCYDLLPKSLRIIFNKNFMIDTWWNTTLVFQNMKQTFSPLSLPSECPFLLKYGLKNRKIHRIHRCPFLLCKKALSVKLPYKRWHKKKKSLLHNCKSQTNIDTHVVVNFSSVVEFFELADCMEMWNNHWRCVLSLCLRWSIVRHILEMKSLSKKTKASRARNCSSIFACAFPCFQCVHAHVCQQARKWNHSNVHSI